MQCCLVCLLQLPKSESFDSITTADSLKALGDLAQKVLNEVLVMCECAAVLLVDTYVLCGGVGWARGVRRHT